MEQRKNKERLRWLLLILGVVIFICLGSVYSWSVYRKPLEEQLGISPLSSGVPYMLFLASYALIMPWSGGLIVKYGPSKVMIPGGLLVGLGWFLSGFAANVWMISVTYGIMAGAGVGMIYGAPIAAMAQWFPERKGLAVGITLGGFGLSPFITAPVSKYLIAAHGPLRTFQFMGLLFIVLIPLLSIPFRFPEDGGEGVVRHVRIRFRELWAEPAFKGLWISFMTGTAAGLMAIGITSPAGEEIIRLEPAAAAFFISTFAVCNAAGRPLFGWLTDRLHPRQTALLSYGMILAASLMMLFAAEGRVVLYGIAFALLWLNLGGWLAIAPAASAIFFGMERHTMIYGYLFTAYGAGAVLGVTISGEIRNLTGSYRYAFYPLILLTILGVYAALRYLSPKTAAAK